MFLILASVRAAAGVIVHRVPCRRETSSQTWSFTQFTPAPTTFIRSSVFRGQSVDLLDTDWTRLAIVACPVEADWFWA